MNKNLLTFTIDVQTRLKIQQSSKNYNFDVYDEAFLIFHHNAYQYVLYKSNVNCEIERLYKFLKVALNNDFKIDSPMQNNVGYYWNHVLNQKINDHQLFDDNYNYLNNFLVWSRANHVTFLYNNNQGDIVFEVIPLYPFTYAYGKNKRTYGYFAKWMKSYKPIFKTIISPEIAHQWIEQAQEILNSIEINTQKFLLQNHDSEL